MTGPSSGTQAQEAATPTREASGTPAIVADGLHHRYGTHTALERVDITINTGEIFGFLGPNGSGKSTLFKILTTLITPTGGHAVLFGHDIDGAAAEVRHLLGVAFQHPSLDGQLSCAENLRHHGHLYGLRGKALEERIDLLLARFGLKDRANDRTAKLSGGMQRRVELAKSILHRPQLLMLDEPATGLDPGARQEVWRDLEALRRDEGVTVVLTTHLMEEAERCDRLAVMNHGRIVALGSPDELKAEIGGDVIYIEAENAESLATEISGKLNVDAQVVDGQIRIERPEAHRFIASLIEAFPGAIETVRIGKPTLEDVFVHRTGHRFWEEDEAERERP